MTKHEEKAKELFFQGFNCAQAVFCAFADELGIDERTAFALSAPFGGGMGRMRQVCGTLSGAFMVLGALYGGYPPGDRDGKASLYARVREIASGFEAESGSILCAELLRAHGLDPSPGGPPQERGKDFYIKRRVCVDSVALSARLLDEYLEKQRKDDAQ